MPEKDKEIINPIDAWGAIQKMKKEFGWELLLERYAKEGDEILSKLLDTELIDNGLHYTKRDLYAHQLETLGSLGKVLNEFESEAKVELSRQKVPPQKGI